MPEVHETEQLLAEYVAWVDAEIARLHGLYDGHYDAWEAAVAAYAHGLVIAADPVDVGWGGGGVTDTRGEDAYQVFDGIARWAGRIGLAADGATLIGLGLSATVVGAPAGAPIAAVAASVGGVAGGVEFVFAGMKTFLTTTGQVRRVDGQVRNDWFGLGMSAIGVLPFSGWFEAGGAVAKHADAGDGFLGLIFGGPGAIDLGTSTDPVDTWRTSMQEQPYVPPARVPGRPWTTTVAPPIPYRPR